MSNRNRQRGKEAERAVAKLLGGKRRGVLGGEDVEHPILSVEVKSRERFVAKGWMAQAIRNCPEGKVPVVIVHQRNSPYKDALVIVPLEEFKALTKEKI